VGERKPFGENLGCLLVSIRLDEQVGDVVVSGVGAARPSSSCATRSRLRSRPTSRRPRNLLAQQRREQRVDLLRGECADCTDALLREGLPEHGRALDEAPLLGEQPVESCGDEGVQGLGDLERLDRAGRAEGRPVVPMNFSTVPP
jgi:hypothetical protein